MLLHQNYIQRLVVSRPQAAEEPEVGFAEIFPNADVQLRHLREARFWITSCWPTTLP